jgi:hypothetical protein
MKERSTVKQCRGKSGDNSKLTMSAENILMEKLSKPLDKNLTYSQIVKDKNKQDDDKLFLCH